jgi:hypothetical protein
MEYQGTVMKIVLDDEARRLVKARGAQCAETALWIHSVRAPKSGYVAAVDWTDCPVEGALLAEVGGIPIWIDRRIATYAEWRPVRIIAGGFGPFRSLLIENPLLMHQIADWERAHPGIRAA